MKLFKGMLVATGLLLLIASPAVMAEDELGWFSRAELSYVATDGNSESTSLGFSDLTRRKWATSQLSIRLEAIRAETTNVDRFAVGTVGDFIIGENTTTNVDAERYLAELKYDKQITEKMFWFVGAGWDKNEPAGIDERYQGFAGVGNIWYDRDDLKWRTDYALSYTDQTDLILDPRADETFMGVRLSWEYLNQFGKNTTYGNDFIVNFNLDESDDYRGDMTNWLSVSMTDRLALKLSLQWLYENMPALEAIPLLDMVGGVEIDSVLAEKDDLDSIFRASLVINF